MHVATPTGLDPADLAVAFGLSYRPATTAAGLRAAVDAGLSDAAVTLVHVHTHRQQNVRCTARSGRPWAARSPDERRDAVRYRTPDPRSGFDTRLTSKRIAPGDIVEVDRKGRRFHALVEQLAQRESGRFELIIRPLQRGVTYRQATVAEVLAVWRRA